MFLPSGVCHVSHRECNGVGVFVIVVNVTHLELLTTSLRCFSRRQKEKMILWSHVLEAGMKEELKEQKWMS